MGLRKPNAFDRDSFAHIGRIRASIVQHHDAAQRVAHQPDREFINDVQQRREIKHVFGNAVHGARRPRAVSVAAQIKRVHVIVLAQGARYPVPTAGMVQSAVHQHQRGLSVLAVIPELQLQPV